MTLLTRRNEQLHVLGKTCVTLIFLMFRYTVQGTGLFKLYRVYWRTPELQGVQPTPLPRLSFSLEGRTVRQARAIFSLRVVEGGGGRGVYLEIGVGPFQ